MPSRPDLRILIVEKGLDNFIWTLTTVKVEIFENLNLQAQFISHLFFSSV